MGGDESTEEIKNAGLAEVCPSWEGMNRIRSVRPPGQGGLLLTGGDDSSPEITTTYVSAFAPRMRGFLVKWQNLV